MSRCLDFYSGFEERGYWHLAYNYSDLGDLSILRVISPKGQMRSCRFLLRASPASTYSAAGICSRDGWKATMLEFPISMPNTLPLAFADNLLGLWRILCFR